MGSNPGYIFLNIFYFITKRYNMVKELSVVAKVISKSNLTMKQPNKPRTISKKNGITNNVWHKRLDQNGVLVEVNFRFFLNFSKK